MVYYGKQFERLELKKGDTLAFNARVTLYEKASEEIGMEKKVETMQIGNVLTIASVTQLLL